MLARPVLREPGMPKRVPFDQLDAVVVDENGTLERVREVGVRRGIDRDGDERRAVDGDRAA